MHGSILPVIICSPSSHTLYPWVIATFFAIGGLFPFPGLLMSYQRKISPNPLNWITCLDSTRVEPKGWTYCGVCLGRES